MGEIPEKTTEENGVFWSSTICSNTTAWMVDLGSGEMTCYDTNYFSGIRAVKSF